MRATCFNVHPSPRGGLDGTSKLFPIRIRQCLHSVLISVAHSTLTNASLHRSQLYQGSLGRDANTVGAQVGRSQQVSTRARERNPRRRRTRDPRSKGFSRSALTKTGLHRASLSTHQLSLLAFEGRVLTILASFLILQDNRAFFALAQSKSVSLKVLFVLCSSFNPPLLPSLLRYRRSRLGSRVRRRTTHARRCCTRHGFEWGLGDGRPVPTLVGRASSDSGDDLEKGLWESRARGGARVHRCPHPTWFVLSKRSRACNR